MKVKIIVLALFASLLLSTTIQFSLNSTVIDGNNAKSTIAVSDVVISDSPIVIRGNDEAALDASSGSGTPSDPFVIENKYIVAGSVQDYIWISLLGIRKYWFLAGISIHGVSASILIRDVVVETLPDQTRCMAFVIDDCDDVDFVNTQTIGPVSAAFYIRGDYTSPASPIVKGDFTVDGFSVEGFLSEQDGGVVFSFVNSVDLSNGYIGNAFDYGLRRGTALYQVQNFHMTGVAFHECAFWTDYPSTFSGYDIDGTNTINGKPILFFNQVSGFSVGPGDNPGQVVALGCSNFEIGDVIMDGGGYYVLLYKCTNGLIHDVEMTRSRYDAAFVVECGGIIIEDCLIHYNIRGGILTGLGDTLRRNIIRNNVIFDNGRNVRPILSFNMEISGNEIYFTEEIIDEVLAAQEWVYLYGIQMMGSNDMDIKNNHIYNVNHAIENEYFYGIGTAYNVNVTGNSLDPGYVEVVGNQAYSTVGIETYIEASDWNVVNNIINNFDNPISLNVPNSVIRGNTINGGIVSLSGDNVDVFLNGFFGCQVGAYGTISFSKGAFGNYWSDYTTKYPSAKRGPHFTWRTPYEVSEGIFDPKPLVRFPLPMNEHAIENLL